MARIDLIPKLVRRERKKIRQTTNGWGRTREERDKIDGGQSFVLVIGLTRDRCTSFVPVGGSNRDKRCMSRLEPPTGIEGGPFFPVGVSNRDKRHMSPPLARLAVGPGIKAIFCPGPKGSRDKWSGTKAYSVVVLHYFTDQIKLLLITDIYSLVYVVVTPSV